MTKPHQTSTNTLFIKPYNRIPENSHGHICILKYIYKKGEAWNICYWWVRSAHKKVCCRPAAQRSDIQHKNLPRHSAGSTGISARGKQCIDWAPTSTFLNMRSEEAPDICHPFDPLILLQPVLANVVSGHSHRNQIKMPDMHRYLLNLQRILSPLKQVLISNCQCQIPQRLALFYWLSDLSVFSIKCQKKY